MSFTGFSSDEEGSIIYDGEKFIVTNPSKVPDNFNAHGKPVIGLPPDHPSHAQNQQTSTEQSTGQASSSMSDEQGSTGTSPREIGPPAPVHRQPILVPPDLLDISEDAVGILEQHIAALYDWQPIAGSARPIEQAPTPLTDEFGYTPLTPGQQMHVDNLLSNETDTLAREVLITLKRDGMPPRSQWNDFMAPYALMGWDVASDAIAWATLTAIAESDWDETFAYADADYVETVAQDLGDNAIEGLTIIDAKTGDVLLHIPGIVREDGSQYVGMQDTEAKALLAEALSGRDLIFLHNHPNDSGASDDDLRSAFDAGAALLIVITPSGREQVFVRGRDRMVLVRDEKASYEVGLENPEETVELHIRSEEQEAAFLVDSPELIFLQDARNSDSTINLESRLVREFFLDPATIVFLEDVANEYNIEDTSLHNAMVFTIIYRELRAPGSLENAGLPEHQLNWDRFKMLMNLPGYFGHPIGPLDGDPSLGIGALNREAILNIENDARRLGMTLYFPMLGFDLDETFDDVPFSQGKHTIERYIGSKLLAAKYILQVLPPTNEEYGAWRVELPRLAGLGAFQKSYEPTLGYVAAEVAIAMQHPGYQKLRSDDERIAFIIGYHANRSAKPDEDLYHPQNFSSDTYTELGWAEDFKGLIDDVRDQI